VLRVQIVSYALSLKGQHVHQKRIINDIHDFLPSFFTSLQCIYHHAAENSEIFYYDVQ
jgi:hypothetical protein